ncbi:hypothetical protein SAMN05428985_105389 [Nocardioides sp. YR527]|uniref:hypothetical protein n=1 Tax=Nocardioides sp. YR527 TaxID=1881028 RepID=UPI0008850C74|nr:hypothetical protein [Nocardioides sp. YR527]SDK70838.1 hypothetical protein SAMN05428985_105389 [Nocardioides sp. YR527]
MNLDLEGALRTSGDLTLDRSLAEIRVRGDRLRRRRTALLIATTTAVCLVVTGLVLSISGRGPLAIDVSPADQSSGPRHPDQVLTWTGKPANVTDAELATIKRRCLIGAAQDVATEASMDPGMPDTLDPDQVHPIFAERRNDFGPDHDNELRAYFLTGDYLIDCRGYTTDSSLPKAEGVVGAASRIKPYPGMELSENSSTSWTTNWIGFMSPVPAEAVSVKFFIGGKHVDGAVNSGIAVAWFSAEGVKKRHDSVGYAAYDADGKLVAGTTPVPSETWPIY